MSDRRSASTAHWGSRLDRNDPSRFIYPLNDFYALEGMELPPVARLRRDEVPEPDRSLLVHKRDMTSVLEEFHGDSIHIHVLRKRREGQFYFREVVLVLDHQDKLVEFGAIKIDLLLFEERVQKVILQERLPLGRILHAFRVSHRSRPSAFFRIDSDDFISGSLGIAPHRVLHGRRNTLLNPYNRPLAEVVEILPAGRHADEKRVDRGNPS